LDASANVVSGWPAQGIPVSFADNDYIDIAADGAGGFYAVWAATDSVMCTRYLSNATVATGFSAAGNLLAEGGFSAGPVDVGLLTSGDAMVAWEDFRNFDPDLFCVRIGSTGAFPGPWTTNGLPVNTQAG